jgi:hypothetical protein
MPKQKKKKRVGRVVQVVKCLLSKHEVSSNPSTTKKKKKKEFSKEEVQVTNKYMKKAQHSWP